MTTIKQHEPGTVTWVDLMTPDIEGARRYYGELFAWNFAIGPAETGHYTMCTVHGDNVAGMGQMPPGAPYPSTWTIYFGARDLDASAARIRELGGQVMMGPMDVMREGRMLVALDPCGAAFGLWQPGLHHGAGRVDEAGAMVWREVNVREVAPARAFYTGLFGLEARPLESPGVVYETLHLGAKTVGGIMQMDASWPADIPAHWMNYFAVDDVDAALRRSENAGGRTCVPAFETPYGRMAVVADPWGATFSIMTPRTPG